MGTLKSLEASLDTAAVAEDLTCLFATDSRLVLMARSADQSHLVENGDGTVTVDGVAKIVVMTITSQAGVVTEVAGDDAV